MTELRILLIGRPSKAWALRLESYRINQIEFDTARLPTEGIRRFEALPPDALIIVDDQGGARIKTLIDAIRARPLGLLVPLMLICPAISNISESMQDHTGADIWLGPEATKNEIIKSLGSLLDMDTETLLATPEPAKKQTKEYISLASESTAAWSAEEDSHFSEVHIGESEDHEHRLMNQVSESAPLTPKLQYPQSSPSVQEIDREKLFKHQSDALRTFNDKSLNENLLLNQLKRVRHSDYFTILGIRRGSESAVVKKAYEQLMAIYDINTVSQTLSHQFFDEFAEIRDALDDAYAILGDPHLRHQYLEGIRATPSL